MAPLADEEATTSWPERVRTTVRMILIAACVGGIEFAYAAETALVSPLLLQLGVPVYLMTLSWCASPLLGIFFVPVLGSLSDTCTSPLGRRRPFIIVYSVGIVIGLLLVPYGKNIGELLGDSVGSLSLQMDNVSVASMWLNSIETQNVTTKHPLEQSLVENDHAIGEFSFWLFDRKSLISTEHTYTENNHLDSVSN